MSGVVIPKSLKLKQSNRLLIGFILLPALQHVSISPPTAFTLDKEVRSGFFH